MVFINSSWDVGSLFNKILTAGIIISFPKFKENSLKYIEVLEKDVGTLKTNSHPPIKGLERRLKKIEKKIRSI